MRNRKKIVVLTGAGISAESGIATFRDSNGLWENHRWEDVASPQGFKRNPELVFRFYNVRRAQAQGVNPNDGHRALVALAQLHDVKIVTQNVDDLHERAGSTDVLHLHGELNKARSVSNEHYVVEWRNDLNLGDCAPDGSQLRPHIVWFGEDVPLIHTAQKLVSQADILLIIGTSMNVYPAAGLIDYLPPQAHIYVIDPKKPPISRLYEGRVTFIEEPATTGVPKVVAQLSEESR